LIPEALAVPFPSVPPGFRPLMLDDRAEITRRLGLNPPETSELTFTNLFMWRGHYRPLIGPVGEALGVVLRLEGEAPFGLGPVGPADPVSFTETMLGLLETITPTPMIARVGRNWVDAPGFRDRFRVVPDPDQNDYVYQTQELIHLAGRKYHQKKNHLNQFLNQYRFEALELDDHLAAEALELEEAWCELRQCSLDPGLSGEDRAVHEALRHFGRLDYRGLVLRIDGRIQAFSLGEPLNQETVVIHVEKANPDIRGLYAAINQLFCQRMWGAYRFINREQDLGREGLRKAKQSYHPHRLVEKFRVFPL
jgi:hypothetical protein